MRKILSRGSFKLRKIIVILGPTASGKSELAVKLAKKFSALGGPASGWNGAEIISADSRQIYRGMDIGTAKPLLATSDKKNGTRKISPLSHVSCRISYGGIPHHLIDIKNPDQTYTVAQYKKDAILAIKKILKKGKLPILVGGTGLYIKAVVDNLEIPEVKPNSRLRKKLEKELKEKGLRFLYEKLIDLDPDAAYIIDRHNPRRVIRALEIILQTKKPFSAQRKQGRKLFNALKISLNLAPEKLKEKIEKRVDLMLRAGFINETERLIEKYDPALPVFDAIGYREIVNYLQGKISLPEAANQIKKNTWHYAKRQMTWFKKDKEIIWITNPEKSFAICRDFLCL